MRKGLTGKGVLGLHGETWIKPGTDPRQNLCFSGIEDVPRSGKKQSGKNNNNKKKKGGGN